MPHPKTFIHGFRDPVRQDGEIVVPMHVHGEMHGLAATEATWRSLVEALVKSGVWVPVPVSVSEAPERRHWVNPTKGGPAAWEDLKAHTCMTLQSAANAHGMHRSPFCAWLLLNHGPEWNTLRRDLREKRAAIRDQQKARRVVTKPNGKLL